VQSTTVLDLDDDNAALPTEAGDVPVMVSPEASGPLVGEPTSVVSALRRTDARDQAAAPLFRDDGPAASWVDDLLDDDDA
jgi:hypothetical protein